MYIHPTKEKGMEKVVWGVDIWQLDPKYVAVSRTSDVT
jgi:hypothetical protein